MYGEHAWPGCSGKSSHSEKSGPSASRSCCALALRRWPASFHSTPMSLQSLQDFIACTFADASRGIALLVLVLRYWPAGFPSTRYSVLQATACQLVVLHVPSS